MNNFENKREVELNGAIPALKCTLASHTSQRFNKNLPKSIQALPHGKTAGPDKTKISDN